MFNSLETCFKCSINVTFTFQKVTTLGGMVTPSRILPRSSIINIFLVVTVIVIIITVIKSILIRFVSMLFDLLS